ncbi:MAG: CDP-alcohol phosphatidyltransferase family protein [Halobacteria archaeon]
MRESRLYTLSVADLVSLANAALGFGALVLAIEGQVNQAARLILLGAVADGLDGFFAMKFGGSEIGVEIDSLCDIVTFGVAPAAVVYSVALDGGQYIAFISVLYVIAAVFRLARYNVENADGFGFDGVPSTLSGVLTAAFVLSGAGVSVSSTTGAGTPAIYLGLSLFLSFMMLTKLDYPDLRVPHALPAGVLILLAAVFPGVGDGVFTYVLLFLVIVFLVFSPRFYTGYQGDAVLNQDR